MDRKRIILLTAVPVLVIGGAATCHRMKRNAELNHQKVLKEQGSLVTSFATVESKAFRGSLPFTGTLLAVNRAELKAEVAGRVTRVTVHEGDRVGAGTVLSAQDEDDLLLGVQAAEAQVAQARAQAQQAQRDNDRATMLLEKRSITKQAAQQAETYFNATSASLRAAESNLGLAKSRLKKSMLVSPFPGEVAQRLIQPGEMLAPGQTAFMVVDNRTLEIVADLPAEAVGAAKAGMKATFRVTGFAEPFTATLANVSPSVQPDGRTLRVRLVVPNADGKLKSGLFAEGELISEVETQRAALPANVLTAVGREAEVFVVDNGIARRRKIAVGADQSGWRPVDLPAGTRIVAQGRDQVIDGMKVRESGQGK
ncbi:MAG: efflux RND transporter periplasmic adaptor subunit [Firmicutes bacterium]|nr:efflux RND transporter periplasmic adaptor subunit [Bacillota bacterium]